MTIHGAKGLEFKYVFLVNMVDKRFPTIERKDLIDLPEELIKRHKTEGRYSSTRRKKNLLCGYDQSQKRALFYFSRGLRFSKKKEIISIFNRDGV